LDDTTVDATLVRPAGKGPFPAVAMVAGSGPTDRDWNSPLLPGSNGSGRLLADALADAGIESLRYDKRASGPRAAENVRLLAGKISMQSHLDEFAGAVGTLAARPEVDAARIFGLANSEGTLHALNYQIAGPTVPLAGIVLIGPPGRAVGVLSRAQISAGVAATPGGGRAMLAYDEAIERFLVGEPVVPDPALPDGARNLLLALTAPVNQPFSRELWVADAASKLAKVEIAVLVVIGKKDVQVDWQDDGGPLERAANGRRDVTFVYPDDADHVLKYEPRPRSELTGAAATSYNAPERRLDPDALGSILDWLHTRVRR
jgi:alpha-beta hydrolase superfamily lysophospholipase